MVRITTTQEDAEKKSLTASELRRMASSLEHDPEKCAAVLRSDRIAAGARAALPLPLAGEGWGVSANETPPSGESPHPHRISDAMRPPPQAGEVKRTCWQDRSRFMRPQGAASANIRGRERSG